MASLKPSRSLISGFFRSLRANPGSSALEIGDDVLTYEQLWNYAGKITAGLKETLDPAEGVVGYGSGKAKEVPQAIRKGIEAAKKNLLKVNLTHYTIPHVVLGHYGAGEVLLKPAPEGTGVIAGKTVRAVMTACGVQNVLTKSLGSANPHNVIKATFDALSQLRDKAEVAALRGKSVDEL